MKRFVGVDQVQLVLLLAAAMASAQALVPSSHNLLSERTSIERTYELTKYLEHQLKEIKDTYLSYLGPPFNEKDFSPPRPNSTALSLPSAATRLELWRGLENRARLAQNQRAYSVLLAAVRELAGSTLCPYLQTSLLHFCTGLDGLLTSISGLMTTLGYTLPPPSTNNAGELQYIRREAGGEARRSRPAPLMSRNLYKPGAGTRTEQSHGEDLPLWARTSRAERRKEGNEREAPQRKRGKEGRRGETPGTGRRNRGWRERGRVERVRRGRRAGPESWGGVMGVEGERAGEEEEHEELEREGGTKTWGKGRRLLSTTEDWEEGQWRGSPQSEPSVSHWGAGSSVSPQQPRTHQMPNNNNNNNNNNNDQGYNFNYDDDSYDDDQYRYNLNHQLLRHDTATMAADSVDMEMVRAYLEAVGFAAGESFSSSFVPSSSLSIHSPRRSPRSLSAPTLLPPLSALSFFHSVEATEDHGLLQQPLPLSLRRATALLSPALPPLLSSSSASFSSAPADPAQLLSVRPALNDFSRKVEGFWILRELQSWLWRSAKDFNRLKKRLRG